MTRFEYWFIQERAGSGESKSGYVFHNDKLGRLIVFDGTIGAGDHFIFRNMETHETEKSETTEAIVETLLLLVTESATQ